MTLMNRLVNELFVRMEGHVKFLDETVTDPYFESTLNALNSDLKLFLLMAGDLAIQVEDFEKTNDCIEVTEDEARRLGLIDSPINSPVDAGPARSDDDKNGLYL